MSVKFEVHSTAKRAALIILFALALSGALIGVRKLVSSPQPMVQISGHSAAIHSSSPASFIAPIITLRVEDASRESGWSAALAVVLNGKTEVPVTNGRIDVLTDSYAIEVDRFDKWHEGIGQAAHYALATGKIACLALIIESDKWPLNEFSLGKLRTIEQTALSKGVKLLILRRLAPET